MQLDQQQVLAFLQGKYFIKSSVHWLFLSLEFFYEWVLFAYCKHCKHSFHYLNIFFNCRNSFFIVTEKYEPVCPKWTTERCAVCRWVEDWDYNKIIICNRWIYNFWLSLFQLYRKLWMRNKFEFDFAFHVFSWRNIVQRVDIFFVQVPNSCPPRMLWSKECQGFYFLGL